MEAIVYIFSSQMEAIVYLFMAVFARGTKGRLIRRTFCAEPNVAIAWVHVKFEV